MPPKKDVNERKEFFALNIRNLICATCLSENRELYSIKNLPQFANLCSGVELTEVDHICWECRASLSNILKFQNKAKYALSCLLFMEENFQPGTNKFMVYNLSSLDTTLKTTYDAEFTHLFDEEQILDDLFQLTREDVSDDDCMDNTEEMPDLSHYPVIQNVMSIAANPLSNDLWDSSLETQNVTSIAENQFTNVFWDSPKESELVESSVVDNRNEISTSDNETDDQTEVIDEDKIQINIMGYKMMMLHREREKRKTKFSSSPLKCLDCIKTFNRYFTLQKHMKVHSKRAGPYMCSICSERFKYPDALASHIKKHYSYYTCRDCNFTTFNIHKIVQHRIKYCDNVDSISKNGDDSKSFEGINKSHEKVNTGSIDSKELNTGSIASKEVNTGSIDSNEANIPKLIIAKLDQSYFSSSGVPSDTNPLPVQLQTSTQQTVFTKHTNLLPVPLQTSTQQTVFTKHTNLLPVPLQTSTQQIIFTKHTNLLPVPLQTSTQQTVFTKHTNLLPVPLQTSTQQTVFTNHTNILPVPLQTSTQQTVFTKHTNPLPVPLQTSTQQTVFTKHTNPLPVPLQTSTQQTVFTKQTNPLPVPLQTSTQQTVFTKHTNPLPVPLQQSTQQTVITKQTNPLPVPLQTSTQQTVFTKHTNLLPVPLQTSTQQIIFTKHTNLLPVPLLVPLQKSIQQTVITKHVNENDKTNTLLKRKLKQKVNLQKVNVRKVNVQRVNVQILSPSEEPGQVKDDPKNQIEQSNKPENNYICAKRPGLESSSTPTYGQVFKMFVSRLDV